MLLLGADWPVPLPHRYIGLYPAPLSAVQLPGVSAAPLCRFNSTNPAHLLGKRLSARLSATVEGNIKVLDRSVTLPKTQGACRRQECNTPQYEGAALLQVQQAGLSPSE